MKKVSIFICVTVLVGLAMLLLGCEGNIYIKPKSEELDISESQITAFIEESLSASTMGLCYDFQEATKLADRYIKTQQFCGTLFDSIVQYAYTDSSHTMGYEGNCSWIVHCNESNVAQSIDFSNHLLCDYKTTDLPRISTTTGNGDWIIAALAASELYTISGQYIRDGYYKTGVEWDQSYYYKIQFSANQLLIDPKKSPAEEGGISFEGYIKDVTLTGIGASKKLEGTVEFLESGEVIIKNQLEGE